MKNHKRFFHAKIISLVLGLVASFLLIEFANTWVIETFYLHWFFLLGALTICFMPFGQKKLASTAREKPRHTRTVALTKLIFLQLSLFMIFIGMTLVYAYWLPVSRTSHPFAIEITTNALLRHDGLFPWGIYALYAITFAYFAYVKNQSADASTLPSHLFNKGPQSVMSRLIRFQSSLAMKTSLAFTFALMTLMLAVLTLPEGSPLLTNLHLQTILIVAVLAALLISKASKVILKILLQPKIPHYICILTTLVLFATIIWLLNTAFVHLGQRIFHIPKTIHWLQRVKQSNLWTILAASWWIALTPVIASQIASLFRGYRVRDIIIACLLFPIALVILITLAPGFLGFITTHPRIFSWISLLALGYFLYVMTEKSNLGMLVKANLPKKDEQQRVDHYHYFREIFLMMLVIICLFLPLGISLVVFVIFIASLFIFLQSLLYLGGSLKLSIDLSKRKQK